MNLLSPTFLPLWEALFAGFAVGFMVFLFTASLERGRPRRKTRKEQAKVQLDVAEKAKAPNPNFLVIMFYNMITSQRKRILDQVSTAGVYEEPFAIARRAVIITISTLFASIAAAIILFPVFIYSPAILIAPVLAYYLPDFRFRNKTNERKRGEENELPFFSIFAAIMQSVGISLYRSFVSIIRSGIFPELAKEAELFKRNVELFFMSEITTLENVVKFVPSPKFKAFLLGYIGEWHAGGDLTGYLQTKTDELLEDLKFTWEKYSEFSSDIGEVIVTIFFMLPLIILLGSFVSPASMGTTLLLIIVAVVPMLTVAVGMAIASAQPRVYDDNRGLYPRFALGLFGLALYPFFPQDLWIVGAGCVMISTAAYGLSVYVKRAKTYAIESALPQFLQDITEYRKIGVDLIAAMKKIHALNHYNPSFDALLTSIIRQLELGKRLREVKVKIDSWTGRMVMFYLSEIADSGGGSARDLEALTKFISSVIRIKKEVKSRMNLYSFLGFLTPPILALILSLATALLTAFSGPGAASSIGGGSSAALSNIGLGGVAGLLPSSTALPPGLIQETNVLLIEVAVALGVLTSKAVNFTFNTTLRIAITVALTIAAIAMSPLLTRVFSGALQPSQMILFLLHLLH